MTKVFIDTNVLIDLLADRKPFSKHSIQIFDLAEKKKVKLFLSSHCFATTHYLLKKYVAEITLRDILSDLLTYIQIISIDQDIIQKSLKSSSKDFEDAIQMQAAYTVPDMFCIVTRNTKDFKDCEIEVFTPEEFLNKI